MNIQNLFIHVTVDRHLGSFQLEAVTNKAAMNICIEVFLWTYAVMSGSCIFNFPRKHRFSQVVLPL